MRGYHLRIVLSESQDSIPVSIFGKLPTQPPKSVVRRNATFNSQNKDYRFGPIRIDWLDRMLESSPSTSTAVGKEKYNRQGPTVATFIPQETTSGSLNLPDGVVHVYRESAKSAVDENASHSSSFSSVLSTSTNDKDDVILGILSVPSWMTPSDLLTFVAPAAGGICHLRIIRDSLPNRTMALISFPKQEDADEFAEAYNGKRFNSLEPELCTVVHVLSVTIDAEDSVTQSMGVFNSPHVYELPTCPVCLERMDSAVTGLITVPCSHTFHCTCLSKWGDSRCPVCRYSQTLLSSHPHTSSSSFRQTPIPFSSSSSNLSSCSTCSSTANLWICLICGNIGCGRYGRAHAQSHYQLTTHLYALELETQRVWDYAGDGYVHRLIQNRADGKLVELPSAASSTGMGVGPGREGGSMGPSAADALTAEKIEAIGIEYSYLLTSQLDSQRSYYEEQQTELQRQIGELRVLIERLSQDIEQEKLARRDAEEEKKKMQDYRESEIVREKNKAVKMTELAKQLQKELREERAVSEGLMQNLGNVKEKAEAGEKEKEKFKEQIADLEDQLRDMMFFLEAKDKIEKGEGVVGEAAGGSIEIAPAQVKKKSKGKKG
ncbi:hypothetical protein E1B28_007416 [Marasmius oreades]|uniref:BRCA1-associated protein n=1 Tax=Marasmius oreades TaxID=181124 RepID=A0A9P7UTR5_9AGAR|nr:uncharacterized protein E1B28_007416 [Marasmius oreades]KAG7093768.1 hypothetical protein E1B28_007416 [Marasmius oreades]